ncbi:hypothetical protein BGZ73_003004 [Actinomortierella ambigua]|nr:hypothetical protein BGZ73_003004 [Actinomortierella ambigua]
MSSLSVGALIGEGAYGSVHHAYWQGRKVAIKQFRMVHVGASTENALYQEIRLLETLHDKHIIQFYGTTHHEGRLVLVMEHAAGGSLDRAIEEGQLDWPNKIRIAQEVVRGLAYIHHMGVIHRDLKSMNVLLTRALEAKLCDFGMATVKIRSATVSTSTKGTFRWMAPELFTAKPNYSTKSDMFALGVVMWELAANCTVPFRQQQDNYIAIGLVKSGEREELPDDTPLDYRKWVERCWDQDPAKRPEASEMVTRDDEPVRDCGVQSHGSIVSVTESVLPKEFYFFSKEIKGAEETSDAGTDAELANSMEALLAKANAGDMEAQIALAVKYEKGEGAGPSDTEALKWYLRAAEQGSTEAQFMAGDYLGSGRGTPKNPAVAAYWVRQAAEGGHAAAQNAFGSMHQNGHGVDQSFVQAALWYRKSADQGNALAQMNLGLMYCFGYGVERDGDQAVLWLRKSADQGNAEAQRNLGAMYQDAYGVERDLEQAGLWLRKSAVQGNALAQKRLAMMYYQGIGAEQDHHQAMSWFRESADQGNAEAQNMIGWMYQHGIGVKQDYTRAFSWYRKSASQGDATGQFNIAEMYEKGLGVERDPDQAKMWSRKAADQMNSHESGAFL